MKITDLKVHIIDMGKDYHLALYGTFKALGGVIRIFTDDGIEGNADYASWGLPANVLAEQIKALKQYIVGQDPFNIERIWANTYKTSRSMMTIYPSGCINVALWDILGKALKTPLYKLLGGYRDRVQAYASTQTAMDADSFIKLADDMVAQGFKAIKLHGWSEPDRDIELSRTIRKAVGDKIGLMIDPMGMYTRQEALRVGKVLQDLNFTWFEEPLPESDVAGYIELSQKLDIPILGQDTLRLSLGNYTDYISRGAFDIVQADAARQGISWVRKLAAISEGFGRVFQAHGYGSPLHQAANLHMLGGISNGGLFEMPVPQGIVDTATCSTLNIDRDGYVNLPQKPGLGLDIDWKRMDEMTTAVL